MILSEQRICQNCKNPFTIEPEDFVFYKKIQVPAPTFCPECRLQRRLAFHNLLNLYKRPCDLCKKDTISMYPPEAPYTVYCPLCWWSDNWDPFSYGRAYDFSRPFFGQFNDLLHVAPLLGLSMDIPTLPTSPYCNFAGHLKNCYLVFWGDYNEDSGYGFFFVHNKSVFDCALTRTSELLYDSQHCFKDYHGVGLDQVTESLDCFFLRDCVNCKNCFASANLRNKQYYIFNKQYSKEEYFEEIKKYDLGSYAAYRDIKNRAEEHWRDFPPEPWRHEKSINVTGNYIHESRNCRECFEVVGAENSRHVMMVTDPPIKDSYDISGWGNNLELSYDSGVVGEGSSRLRFCHDSGIELYDAEYCKQVFGGSHQFGCVSAKKGTYCVLNKKYPKEDFENLRTKIVQHMNDMPYIDPRGTMYRYGEFFPADLSPSAYNETLAQKFFPLAKKEALAKGYGWRDEEVKTHTSTMQIENLPDHIKDAPDSIVNEIICCAACGKGYKIVPIELAFLRRMHLPLPRECPFCRIGAKFDRWVKKKRMLLRTCDKCGDTFSTPYEAKEAPSIFCKKCWQEQLV